MLETGTSGLMSGEGKQPAASRSRYNALPRLYAAGRHVREVAHTRGKSPAQEYEHCRADSPSRRRLRQAGLRPPRFLWRRFFRWLLVNAAHSNRKRESKGAVRGVSIRGGGWRIGARKRDHPRIRGRGGGKVGIAGGDFQGAVENRILVFQGSVFSTAHYVRTVTNRDRAIQVLMNGHGVAGQGIPPAGFIELPPLIANRYRVVLSHHPFGLNREDPIQVTASAAAERCAAQEMLSPRTSD
jgi:hypothetical protein